MTEIIKGNEHDLIMQFARGTEALTLFSKLSALADSYDERKHRLDSDYYESLSKLHQGYWGQVNGAIRETRNRLRDLQADDDDDGYHESDDD